MTVLVDGQREYVWPVSTGIAQYSTPSGSYAAFRMEEFHFSKEWDDAAMPHSIFFTRSGHAIHGTEHVDKLGRRASHGCVRLDPENAAALFALVKEVGLPNTTVVVKGQGEITTATVARRKAGKRANTIAVAEKNAEGPDTFAAGGELAEKRTNSFALGRQRADHRNR